MLREISKRRNRANDSNGDGIDIVAVIPAYNEARFIGSVVLQARKHAGKVIVVDDGSSDRTAEIAEAAGALVVRHDDNRGKGAALSTGIHKALTFEPVAVVMLDGDFQHLPQQLPRLVAPILEGRAHIVVGSRYLDQDSIVPRHRIWAHRAFNLLIRLGSGVRLSDSQNGFRAFSRRALEGVSFVSDDFTVESEIQFLARERGLRIEEVPVTIQYLDKPKRSVVGHGLIVLNGVLQLVGQYRPLLFFGVPGLAMLLTGLGWGWIVVDVYRRTQQLAVGYALISVLLSILGSLGLFAGIILHSVRGLLLELVGRGMGE